MNSLLECYDEDGDGSLGRDEFDAYVADSLAGREDRCTATDRESSRPISMALTSSEKKTILDWTSGKKMKLLYSLTPGNFSKVEWIEAVALKSNLIFIGKTKVNGTVVGGFTGSDTMPDEEAMKYLSSRNAFIFNLKTKTKWNLSSGWENIWANTYTYRYSDTYRSQHGMTTFGSKERLNF